MHSMRAGYVNELLLMLYRRKTILFAVCSAVLPVLVALSLHSLQPILGLVAVSPSFSIQLLDLNTAIWIPLFIVYSTADLFPNEIAARTLKLSLLRPNTRFQVYATKAAALGTGIAGLLILLGAVTMICNAFAGSSVSFNEGYSIVKAYFAAFVTMLTLAAVCMFLAQFFKTASAFMVFTIVLYAAAKLLPFFAGSLAAFSPVSYTNWHMLWLNPSVAANKLVTGALFLASSFILFFSLGYYIFDRKEV